MTFDERHTMLSALIDREAVDPDVLAAALDDPAGRAMLVDFVRLRLELQREDADTDDLEARRLEAAPRSSFRVRRLAAAVLLPLAIGLASGWWLADRSAEVKPPTPSRVLSFTPGVDWR
jgi:hypothetical protein